MRVGDKTLPVSYRQIDYWIRRGWIAPDGDPFPGHGYPRAEFTGTERLVLEHMARLVADGVTPQRAHTAARELVTNGHTYLAGHLLTAEEVS